MKIGNHLTRRWISMLLVLTMVLSVFSGVTFVSAAENDSSAISNDSLKITVGDLGQISTLNIVNNPTNNRGREVNFVLPNDTSPQNGTQHQWMGEMIFSVRSSEDGTFPEDNSGFVEVDTNRTLAAGGSTTASNIASDNPYFSKTVEDQKITVNYTGQDLDSTTERTMKGFDVESSYDMATEDGSLLWTITIKNKSDKYLEFGDVGLPMPWNNKYTSQTSVYNERVTAHTFAGADSGYAYAIRCSGEGNYILFTPVAQTGARIEYVDNWIGSNNGVSDNRTGSLYSNWTADSGGWQPGLSVYYIHSKDIHKTGRSYFEDATSLVLEPGESQTYQFKFSAIRAGDNTPQESAESANNASASIEERENNLRSILYQNGMIDAVAVPSFQTALNMDTRLDLHYDEAQIKIKSVDIQCVHENDPYGEENSPEHTSGTVNNSRTGRGEHDANEGYTESVSYVGTQTVDGEAHHIYSLHFGCIGNNSIRVEYQLKVGEEWVDKFTQYEFNVLTELDEATETHADFVVNETQDADTTSATYGIYSDWYFASGRDYNQRNHWGDDWSHDNINFITMKNYLNPDAEQVKSIETYLIDFMWENYMKNTQDSFTVANYLSASGVYSTTSSPYTRTFSEVMEATGFFNMYRIVKAYPDLIEYRKPATWYLEKAYGIYYNRVDSGAVGYYGEQQIPDLIEALYAEGMTEEGDNLKQQFAQYKGSNCVNAAYPYGSEFAYDNTGEEGAFAAAKALAKYYPESDAAAKVETAMSKANHKTRAMRGIQPTWYQYADPAFIGGESWWNFQYTASLAGSIMDDWLRYESNDGDSTAWAARVNYAAKLSNFNAINMGQIASTYVGNVSWRYNMYKGGYGAMNVNDGGTRVMNNGWQDFSGESDEGLYGSLLRISADVTTDPVFGLYGYGATVTKSSGSYSITPTDGFGKRVNLLDEKIYVETVQDTITKADIAADGSSIQLTLKGYTSGTHTSEINLSGTGLSGFYSIACGSDKLGQVYIGSDHEGTATITVTGDAVVTLKKDTSASNEAPKAEITSSTDELKAVEPFTLSAKASDDGAPEGSSLTYKWEVKTTPDGASFTFGDDDAPSTTAKASVTGEYEIALTVSDGEKSTIVTKVLQIGNAPEREAPVITSASGAPLPGNPSVAALTASATTDALYEGTPTYKWEVVSTPEGASARLGDADNANAKLLADKPGEYVLKLTVTDADKTAATNVTINFADEADGIQRVTTVVTKVGTAPELPTKVSAVAEDGTYSEKAVTWNAVSADKYTAAGTFEVSGTLQGEATSVACKVVVVEGERKNIAPFATATAIINTPSDLGGVAGLNDGYDPSSSRDTSHGVWHNWHGEQGSTAWVQYTWDSAVTIDGADAYYFTDGNFQPKDAKLEYLAEDGNWYEVPNASGLGTDLNKYNSTTFSAVTTTSIRMLMNPKTLGVGVIEWKVYGYGNFVDTTALKAAISTAQAIDTDLFVEGTEAVLNAAIAEAQSVLNKGESLTQEEADAAAATLNKVVAGLESADGNLAYTAQVTTSFVSSWESLDAVNDGKTPSGSYDPSKPRYGTWGNSSGEETITYTWGANVEIDSTDLYLWYDGDEGNYTSGGILVPKTVKYEYLTEDGEWAEVPNAEGLGLAMDSYNKTTFDPITTTSLRVTLTKQNNDGNGVGVLEWKVYGKVAEEPAAPTYEQVTDLSKLESSAEYLVVAWRYFGGTQSDSTNGYVFQAENNGNVRAATEDGYKTVTGTFDDNCLWRLSYADGKLTMQNVGSGKYLGEAIPAASDTAYGLTVASGSVNGYSNFAIGTDANAIRFSGSGNKFSFGGGDPASAVTATNACNLTIYKLTKAPVEDKAVKNTEKLIDAIGTVTKQSGDAIDAARSAYDALTEEQQNQVSNYEKLVEAEKAYAELNKPDSYQQVTDLAELEEGASYLVVAWRYFGGTESDSTNGYVFQAENNGNVRAATTDGYKTVTGTFNDNCLWNLTYKDGKLSMKNVGTGKYLGTSIPADSDTAYGLTVASGEVNGYSNFAIGVEANAIRYSGSGNKFSYGGGAPASAATATNACNLTIYKIASAPVNSHTIVAMSDYQNSSISGSDKMKVPQAIVKKMTQAGVDSELALLGGDYVDGSVYEDGSDTSQAQMMTELGNLKSVISSGWSDIDYLAIQGNHDYSGFLKDNTLNATGAYEYDDYIIYLINEDDFPWWQAGYATYSDGAACKATVESTSQELETYLQSLISADDDRPVIIMSHVPMHWSPRSTTGQSWWNDNIYADILFDVVNEAGESLDIVFLFGHNHSSYTGTTNGVYYQGYDQDIGGALAYVAKGESMRVPNGTTGTKNYTTEPLSFTYMNAGYVGNYNGSQDDCTISAITITDDVIQIDRYGTDGLRAESSHTIQRGDFQPILHLESAEDRTDVRRPGETEQFRAQLSNAEATAYSWSCDPAIATITNADTAEPTLTYTGDGELTLTCTVTYGDGETVSGTYVLTVETEAVPDQYEQVTDLSTLNANDSYLVVAWRYFGGTESDSTNGYVFQAENNGNVRAATEDGYKTISGTFDDKCFWKLSFTDGKLSMQNVGTGKFLGETIPADRDTAYSLTVAEGSVSGYPNFAIGTASNAIRFSGSSNKFSFAGGAPESAVTATNACNLTIYKTASVHTPVAVEAKEANCHETGMKACWYCEHCETYYADEACTTEIDPVIPVDLDRHDGEEELRNEKAATYTEEGYTGDIYCLGCGHIKQGGKVIPKLTDRKLDPVVLLKATAVLGAAKAFPFEDVPATSWYYDSVYAAWDNGLIDGVTATLFKPDDQLTVAQAIKLAAVLYQMQTEGFVSLTNGSPNWYDSYVAYAVNHAIIEKAYLSYTTAQMNAPATRGEFVHIFSGALLDGTVMNKVTDNKIPDVKTTDKYGAEIYRFYRAGITIGSDAKGTFHPNSNIKRSEVAAIVERMFDTTARKTISLS